MPIQDLSAADLVLDRRLFESLDVIRRRVLATAVRVRAREQSVLNAHTLVASIQAHATA